MFENWIEKKNTFYFTVIDESAPMLGKNKQKNKTKNLIRKPFCLARKSLNKCKCTMKQTHNISILDLNKQDQLSTC